MFQVVKRLEFCYGHRLLNYEGKCAHPHGHNGIVEVKFVTKSLDHRGMVIDFGDIKKAIKNFLDQELDHKMLLRQDDPLVAVLQKMQEPVYLMEENPTAENIAKLIFQNAHQQGLPVSSVRLWETSTSYAEYEGA